MVIGMIALNLMDTEIVVLTLGHWTGTVALT